MENNFETYLTSGQFAKLMGISKDTLFHYDRTGILSPVFKLKMDIDTTQFIKLMYSK